MDTDPTINQFDRRLRAQSDCRHCDPDSGIWLSRKAGSATRSWLTRIDRLDPTLVPMLGALVRYAGLTLTIVISLSTFGVETTSVIAVLGAVGIAIGLALQGTSVQCCCRFDAAAFATLQNWRLGRGS